jgi:pyruvate/2-oxoglutarate dehydrogenase complex dihydrolipoamide dehydrogenase (E3) component
LHPDAIVIATGSEPLHPKEFSSPKTFTVFEVLTRELELGSEVVVIGGGGNGAETAEYLAERGKKVTIVEQFDEIAHDLPTVTRAALLFSLKNHNINIITNTVVERVKDGEVLLSKDDKRFSMKADSVIVAVGHAPNKEIAEEMKKVGCDVYTCGDVNRPRDIHSAVKEGLELGLKI